MANQRTHHVTTSDGVTIGATVHGQGPPLVFLQGVIGDGDLDWGRVAEHLSDRFTCHLPSMRGRGLSGNHPDLSIDRLVQDVIAYVDSIGDSPGLVGWSLGAGVSLLVASRSDAISAVAPLDPLAVSQMDEDEQAALGGAVARTGALAAEGDLTAAVRAFADYPFDEKDIVVAEETGYFKDSARYVPEMLSFFQHLKKDDGPPPDDPTVLGTISVPTLVLYGSETAAFGEFSARHVSEQVATARLHAIPGAGHTAPLTHPEELAEALAEFFAPADEAA